MDQLDIGTFRAWVDAGRAAKERPTLKDWKQVHSALRACFHDAAPQANAFNLTRLSVILHKYLTESLQPYHDYAWTIADAHRGVEGGVPTPEQWQAAIALLAAHEDVLAKTKMSESSIFNVRAQEVEMGLACAHLKSNGFALIIDVEGNVEMSDDECQRLGERLDQLATRMGGENVLIGLFQLLESSKKFDATHGRWHLTRPSHRFDGDGERAQVPWGYLYNLGIKHFGSPGLSGNKEVRELFELARAGATVMSVQPFNPFEGMNLVATALTEYLIRSVVYDSLFTFSQVDGSVASKLMTLLAEKLKPKQGTEKYNELVAGAAIGCEIIRSSNLMWPVQLRAKDIASSLRMSRANVRKTLDSVYAHTGAVNSGLTFPPRSTDIDASDRPLLRVSEDVYWCPPRAMSAKAALQSMLELVDRAAAHAGSSVGTLIEEFFVKSARARGLNAICGKYDLGKDNGVQVRGDCDLVVQTSEAIVFLEAKKKGLNKASRSGDVHSDLSLLVDLTQSVVSSQVQALRHETLLRKHGKLVLTASNGETSEITWNQQKVYRVSVSLFDTGGLQDGVTLRNYLTIGAGIQIGYPNSSRSEDVDKVNKLLSRLNEQAKAVGELGQSSPFSRSFQLSASQLLVLFQNSNSNVAFVEQLTQGSRLINGTQDFYAHRLHMNHICAARGV